MKADFYSAPTNCWNLLPLVAFLVSTALVRADALDNWAIIQVSTNRFGVDCVTYANGRYVAFGEYSDYGAIISSEDGKVWTLRSDGDGQPPSGLSFAISLIYTGGRFFAMGGFGTSGVSSNGIDWSIFSLPNYSGAPGVAFAPSGAPFGPGTFVAAGDSGSTFGSDLNVFTSYDGITWAAQHSTSPSGASLGDVAYGLGKFVAIGINYNGVNDNGHIYTSTNGTNWTQRTILGGSRVSFARGRFIVPYGAGTNLISSDGINWNALNTGVASKLGKVTFANGLFMARAGSNLATSTNGTNWVQYPQILPGNSYSDQFFATDGARLVTVGGVSTGPPFYYQNGFVYLSDPLVGVRLTTSDPPKIAVSGLVGRTNRIEYTDALATGTNNWQTLTTLELPSSPYLVTDSTATNSSQRFYRGVLLP